MCSEQQASSIAKFSFCTVQEAKQAAQGPNLHFRGLKRLVTHCGNWVHRRPSELAAAASTGCRPQIPSQQPNESLFAWIGMQCEGVICPVLKGKLRGELEESAFLIQIFKSHSPSAGSRAESPSEGTGKPSSSEAPRRSPHATSPTQTTKTKLRHRFQAMDAITIQSPIRTHEASAGHPVGSLALQA